VTADLDQSVRGLLRHNVLVNVVEASIHGLAWGLASTSVMLALFVSRLTGSAVLIGLVSALQTVAWQLPQLFMANRVARLRCFRPTVTKLTLNERVPYLGLALVAYLTSALGSTAALVLTGILLLWQGLGSGGVVANPWQNMVAKIIPREFRGTFLGTQAALRHVLISAAAVAPGYLLTRVDDRADFALCFLLAAVGMFTSMLFLGMTREPVDRDRAIPPRRPPVWRGAWEVLRRDRNFAAYLCVRLLANIATWSGAAAMRLGSARTTATGPSHWMSRTSTRESWPKASLEDGRTMSLPPRASSPNSAKGWSTSPRCSAF
jgi:hypothetical protein